MPFDGFASARLLDEVSYVRARRELLGPLRSTIMVPADLTRLAGVLVGDQSLMRLYGRGIYEFGPNGVQIHGRTVIEAAWDGQVHQLAEALRAFCPEGGPTGILDLFAGSGNIGVGLARAYSVRAWAAESDPLVYAATATNASRFDLPLELLDSDYRSLLNNCSSDVGSRPLYVVDPPWGEALAWGQLDYLHTKPPIGDVLSNIADVHGTGTAIVVLKTTQLVPGGFEAAFVGYTHIGTVIPMPRTPRGGGPAFHLFRLDRP